MSSNIKNQLGELQNSHFARHVKQRKEKMMQHTLNSMLGKKVIIRTFSAGCWFGKLEEKSGNEVILKDARRMYYWWATESISLSGVALYGVKQDKSKIIEPVPEVWLECIEIIPCSEIAIKSLESAPHVKAN